MITDQRKSKPAFIAEKDSDRIRIDRFSTWNPGLGKKFDAAQDVADQLLDGSLLPEPAAERGLAPIANG